MHTLRAPLVGVLLADPTDDALGALSRFDEPDGSFGFRLLPVVRGFSFSSVGPGESLEFGYDYFATASTGFGETAVFAAIGDPFHLDGGGGSFQFQVGDELPTDSVPEPGSLATFGIGLAVLCLFADRHRIGRRKRLPHLHATRVKSSPRIEGHHMVSMCSITNSVPRA
jgi:hypothetical protein